MKQKATFVQQNILTWARAHPRQLPWKVTKDAYLIWVSEIILQQTQVVQGKPYYTRFIKSFPSIFDLANASEEELMKVWEGLGYYRRARYMHETAQKIVNDYDGVFPDTYPDILKLKGIGPYTAAAISSFAFELPYPVVDGNVVRVISRIYGINDLVTDNKTLNRIHKIATSILFHPDPGRFNQAIMDFGAMQCKPKNPSCASCILKTVCLAHKRKKVQIIPRKKPASPKQHRIFYYLLFRYKGLIFIRKRTGKDIWQHLFEFYLIETKEEQTDHELTASISMASKVKTTSKVYSQTLSHQKIKAKFIQLEVISYPQLLKDWGFIGVAPEKIRNFAFPKIIDWYLKDISL
jgi:A/G-specific adenine glycosylase